jgi:hypothetical protein
MGLGQLWRRGASTCTIVLACLLLPVSGAQAGETWSEPLAVSPTDQYAEEPSVAIEEHGDAVVVWRQSINSYESAIQVSVKPAGGSFSAPIELLNGPGQNQEPEVALGPAGEVIVVWGSEDRTRKIEGERLMFSEGSVATGVFSAPKAIATDSVGGGGLPLNVGIDRHGEALVVWQGMADNMLYATRAPGAQTFSAPVEVSNPGLSLDRPGIAIASDGAAVLGWTGTVEKRTNGKSWVGAFAAVREPGGAFAPAQTLELAPCMRSDRTYTEINDAGQAVVSWTAEKPECESVISDGVRASYRTPGEPFQTPARIAPETLNVAGGDAVSPNGTVTVSGHGTGGLIALTRMPDGSYGDREVISDAQSLWDSPALAADAAGNLYAASDTREWVPGPEPGEDVPESTIIANIAPADEGFAAESSLLQTGYKDIDSLPVIATAGDGQAAMIWSAGTVASRRQAYLSMAQPEGSAPPPSSPPTPETTAPPPARDPNPAPPSATQTSSPSPALAPSSTTSPQRSVLAATEKGTGTALRSLQMVVRGRVGSHASAVTVRLLRGGKVLRAAHAHIDAGHFHALLSIAGLPHGRYRLQILLRRGARERVEQRWISVT